MSGRGGKGRIEWRRCRVEQEGLVHSGARRQSVVGIRRAQPALWNMDWIALPLALAGLWRRGLGNARRITLQRLDLPVAGLPAAFSGFRILHLSDLHVGNVPGLMAEAARMLSGIEADLVVMTGDFQTRGRPTPAEVAAELAPLLAAVKTPGSPLAVLGNHDQADLVPALEGLGVRVLINEAHEVRRNGETLTLVGVDDVHAFHTPRAPEALLSRSTGMRVALVHTADLATLAAEAGYGLYLCGHTHGGQICLPGGRPLYTVLDSHRSLARAGTWHWRGMAGHTSPGLGSSRPPIRLNCPPAATLITLVDRACIDG